MQPQPDTSMPMRMQETRSGDGSIVHRLVPMTAATAPKGGKKRVAPDPIKANPDSAAKQLALLIERIERLEEEKCGIADDIKDVYAEAKATGYDTKGIRAIIQLRRMDPHNRQEAEAILDTYKTALGIA